MKTKLSKLKKKDLFYIYTNGKKGKTVYVFNGGGKVKGFSYFKYEDVNAETTTKKDKDVCR